LEHISGLLENVDWLKDRLAKCAIGYENKCNLFYQTRVNKSQAGMTYYAALMIMITDERKWSKNL